MEEDDPVMSTWQANPEFFEKLTDAICTIENSRHVYQIVEAVVVYRYLNADGEMVNGVTDRTNATLTDLQASMMLSAASLSLLATHVAEMEELYEQRMNDDEGEQQ